MFKATGSLVTKQNCSNIHYAKNTKNVSLFNSI